MPTPTTLSMPRGMWGEPYRIGVNGAHNTVGENVSAYNTAWVLSCQGGRRVLFLQVRRVLSLVLLFDLCALPYFLRPFPGPYPAGVPGRSVLVGSDRASQRRVVSRGLAHPRSETQVGDESRVWLGLPVGEAVQRWARDQSERSGRRGGLESEAVAVPPRPGLPVGDQIALLACRLGTWAGPRVCMLFATLSAGLSLLLGSRSMRDPGFMNPTRAPEPPGDSGRIVRGIFVFAGGCARAHPRV